MLLRYYLKRAVENSSYHQNQLYMHVPTFEHILIFSQAELYAEMYVISIMHAP